MTFRSLWIFILIPLIFILLEVMRKRQRPPSLRIPSKELISGLPVTFKMRLYLTPWYLRLLAVGLFCVALAGPQKILKESIHRTQGIDMVLAIDASGSMAGEDFKIAGQRMNRLTVVKTAVNDFIDARADDRMGLVAFSGKAYTVSPLTLDHAWLKANLERIQLNMMEDGTAIGSAIMTSLSRLKKSQAKTRIVILLTDGMNNAGKIDPVTAAQTAHTLDVRIYTIGAGTRGLVPYPVRDLWGRKFYQNQRTDIDEVTLKKIAELTGGKYFRATDTESLRKIYQEIDALEKTVIEQTGYQEYDELFPGFLIAGLVILFLELMLSNSFLLKVP